MLDARLARIADLRARVETPRVVHQRLPTGIPGLEGWLGGWSAPGVTELVGRPGSGRLAPILPALAALTQRGRTVVLVDPLRQLHPPGLGLDLSRVLLVRPPGDQACWAAEQVARSGAVDAMLVLDPPRLGRGGLRLARACEGGNTAVFVVAEEAEGDLPAAMRLRVEGWEEAGLRLVCTRSRDGRAQGERVVAMEPGAAPKVEVAPPPKLAKVVELPRPANTPPAAPKPRRLHGRKRAAEGNVVALFAERG